MISKKQIIVLAGAFLGSVVLSFLVSFILRGRPSAQPAPDIGRATAEAASAAAGEAVDLSSQALTKVSGGKQAKIRLSEQQLNELIRQLHSRIREFEQKQQELNEREQRIEITQKQLDQRAEKLQTLRMELVGPINTLKGLLAEMHKTQIAITRQETENLRHIASIYDTMDSTSSSEIFTEMCTNNQMDDAVKLLTFMSERKAGQVLAEMKDKTLAARLSQRLKSVKMEG